MQKKIFLFLVILFSTFSTIVYGQYGNEWIVPGQAYYKFSTAQSGMYAVSFSELQAAGVNMGVDPRLFQLWHRGVEQNIWIKGEGDGQFNPGDSLIFYGKINDGTLDTKTYFPPTAQPHTYYNLYNDTTAFFLTWGASQSTHRMPLDLSNTVLPAEAFHMAQSVIVLTDEYSRGTEYGEATQSYGDLGEGWCGTASTSSFTKTIPLSNVYTGGGNFTVEVMIVGRNNTYNRNTSITISNLNSSNIVDVFPSFSLFDKSVFSNSYSSSLLGSSSITITTNGTATSNNYYSIAYVKVSYPQTTDMGGLSSKTFTKANTGAQSYYTVNWTSSVAPVVFDVTDKNNLGLLNYSQASNNVNVFVPPTVNEFIVMQSDAYLHVPVLKSVDMSPYDTLQDFLIISHKKLWTEAQEYAFYRESAEGGSHGVLLTDVEKLYNQFAYGELTPVAIKGFTTYQIDHNKKVKSLFIIGKGIDINYYAQTASGYYRKDPNYFINNAIPEVRVEDLIPAFGSPPSDIYYAMKKIGSHYVPSISVGRLSAKSGVDVTNYLDKVRYHETHLDSNFLWRKKLVHLVGGADAGQLDLFKTYMQGFKSIVENSIFRGKVVKTYFKDLSSGAIDQANIAEYVNTGLSYITFFGHSSYFVSELDIGYVSNPILGYANSGKYPMLIINGCSSGAVYVSSTSLTEDWLNTYQKGAIAALGVSDIGYTSPLNDYTSKMYTALFNTDTLIGKSAAQVMKNMLQVNTFDDQTTFQMNFHGDPQVVIYSPRKTDYEISGDKETRADQPEYKCFLKSFDNKKITASTDSFQIGIPVKNFGIYNKENYMILVKRTVNGKETVYKEVEYPPVAYLDTLFFTVKGNNSSFYGLNEIVIEIDSRDTIHEMREDNNIATLDYFMSVSGVTCIYPKEYSIVHNQPVTFIAQATNLFVEQRQYYIEVDTNYKFTSGFKKSAVITSGSLIKWPNVSLYTDNNKDSIVYYWRVRFNTFAQGEDTVWGNSSFIYIKGSPDGWSQSEAPQFVNDIQNNVNIDLADSTWKFAKSSIHLELEVFGNGDSDSLDNTNFKVGDVTAMFPGYKIVRCGPIYGTGELTYEANGPVAVVLDKSSVQNYILPGTHSCGRWPSAILADFSSYNWYNDGVYIGNAFLAWLQQVPPGDYIMFGNSGNMRATNWPAPVKSYLANWFGAQLINQVDDNEPYILLAKKGLTSGTGTAIIEKHSDNTFASLKLDTTITGRYNNGSITSTRIGPATEWGTFYQRVYSSGQDKHTFSVIRESLDGKTIDTLKNLSFTKNIQGIDTLDLKPLIPNPQAWPYIRLLCNVYDSLNLDPPQLDKWQVIYHKSPEGTMDPYTAGLSNYTVPNKDEGASVCIPYVFENIEDLSFGDSLYVSVSLKGDAAVVKDTSFIVHKDSLRPGESFAFNYCVNTKGLSGRVTMRTFVNDPSLPKPRSQSEEYYSNNFIETYFEVIKDRIPPVIDVTFDGIHIMDGDIVSPSPNITIVLNDNSKYLLINDPNDISIFFKKPGATQSQILPSNPDVIRFGQTPGGTNTFTIEYNPKDLPDGEYTLVVQGKDVNGNKSGQYYQVTFTVENASTISNFYPYPNPFSSSTKFVFTLTGRYIPDDLKIQIMTVTGKVVREITKEELGHIHIGNNKTEYAWNGTDEFGDKLANGVYLYRVILKDKGDNFEHRNTAGDKAFKKEFGKIYILR
jgi:hypothetical protein